MYLRFCKTFFLILQSLDLFFKVELIYNVVLISAVQRYDSVIYIYICMHIYICIRILKYSFPLCLISAKLFHPVSMSYLVPLLENRVGRPLSVPNERKSSNWISSLLLKPAVYF